MSWSTGFYSFVQNQQAPYYPNATLYAPQFPDPASVESVVRGHRRNMLWTSTAHGQQGGRMHACTGSAPEQRHLASADHASVTAAPSCLKRVHCMRAGDVEHVPQRPLHQCSDRIRPWLHPDVLARRPDLCVVVAAPCASQRHPLRHTHLLPVRAPFLNAGGMQASHA